MDFGYPISAIVHDTPLEPVGPAALPGAYTVRLTVDGKSHTQPLIVKMDPRVHMTAAELAQQHSIGVRMLNASHQAADALAELRKMRGTPATPGNAATAPVDSAATKRENELGEIENGTPSAQGQQGVPGLARLQAQAVTVLDIVEGADMPPTSQTIAVADRIDRELRAMLDRWQTVSRRRGSTTKR